MTKVGVFLFEIQMSCCVPLTSAQKAQAQVIESQVGNLIQELITARQGTQVATSTEIALIAFGLLKNVAALENISLRSIPLNEQTTIIVDIIQQVYPELIKAGLVPAQLQQDIQILFSDLKLWEPIIQTSVALYEAIAQVAKLPTFQAALNQNNVKLEGFFGDLRTNLTKFQIEKKPRKLIRPPVLPSVPVPPPAPTSPPAPTGGPIQYKPVA